MRIEASATPTQLRLTGASDEFVIEAAGDGDPAKPKRFSMVAYTGAAMQLGLGHPVVIDLAGMKVGRQSMPILRGHDAERIVGHTDSISVNARNVKAAGVVSGIGDAAAEVLATASNGFPWQASVGASVERMEFVERGAAVKVNGRSFAGPVYVARATSLYEISFVPVGADGETSASVAASLGGMMDYNTWLSARGIADAASLTEPVRLAPHAAWKAETNPAPVPTPAPTRSDFDAEMAAARDEADRRQRVTVIVARAINEAGNGHDAIESFERLGRLAIEGRWTAEQTELEILRASRPSSPHVYSTSTPQVTEDVLEASLCRAAGLQDVDKQFDDKTLTAADKHYKRGIGLQELFHICATRNGYRGQLSKGNLTSILRTAMQDNGDIRASVGTSTISTPGILSNVANKFSRESFLAVESVWQECFATRPVGDFKTITSYALTGDLTYDEIPAGGEIKHGTLGEETYTNRAKHYGKMLGIDYVQLRNDDLNAFAQVGKRLGRGGGLKVCDVVWGAFLNNASFFTSGRVNYDDGASDTIMDLTGMANAHGLFMALRDPDGKPTGARPRIVLVPTALWPAAFTITQSQQLNLATSTAASTGTANPWAGMFRLLTSLYLSDSTLTGYSSKAWYMLAEPADLPVLEVCFLDGQQQPTVEEAQLSADRTGVLLRATHAFGAALQEYRGGVKMKGEN